jgi:hypothetical protein
MQTELAQIISLTSFGNEFIRNGELSSNYFSDNTVFKHCKTVDFRDVKKAFFFSKRTETIASENPLEWFRLLKKEGCIKLRLYYKPAEKSQFGPEYNLAGFVGGAGTWLIETNYGNYSHYWQKRWQATDKGDPDNKIWSVNYARFVQKFAPTNQQVGIPQTKSKFAETINELIDFCDRQQLKNWLETFKKASEILSASEPSKLYYHYDLIVRKNYSLPSQQLLFAAGAAWFFGGMGWWNDMGFEEQKVQEKYLQLSQQLYDQLIQSILATINSY